MIYEVILFGNMLAYSKGRIEFVSTTTPFWRLLVTKWRGGINYGLRNKYETTSKWREEEQDCGKYDMVYGTLNFRI